MNSHEFQHREVAFFNNCKSKTGGKNHPLVHFIDGIRSGRWAKLIVALRSEEYKSEAYTTLKRRLPSVMLSASTRTGGHKATDILYHSGLLQIDVDDIGSSQARSLRDSLAADPHILATWLSPSGLGVKAALCIPASVETHGLAFYEAERLLRKTYGVGIDPKCKDPCRLCFVSYDPDLRVNESPAELLLDADREGARAAKMFLPIVQRDGVTEKRSNRDTEPHRHRDTEVVGVVRGVEHAVLLALPSAPGNNHNLLFLLARAVKTLEIKQGKFTTDRLREVLDSWYRRAIPFLRTGQTKGEYLMEFLAAYDCAKYPLGAGVIEEAWHRAQTTPIPPDLSLFTDDPQIRLAAALCRELQRMHGDQPFFLASRTLAGLLKHGNHSTAATWMKGFCVANVLQEVEKGGGVRASRYRYLFTV